MAARFNLGQRFNTGTRLNQPPLVSVWFTGVAHALPVILDKDEKPVVLLHEAYSIMIYEEHQSEDRLEFAMPGPGPPELKVSAILDLAGRYYRVIRIRNLEDDGIRTLRIEAWALWYDLAKMPELPKIKWNKTTIAEILDFLMPGSGWAPSAIGIAQRRNLTWDGGTNRLECLREIERVFNAEIVWNTAARGFSVLASDGVETGVWFLRGRNLKKFEVESDFRDTVHRIYPRGRDGLTIAGVNGGVPYLEIPSALNPPPSRVLLAEEFTDPVQLKLWAQAEFAKIKEPKVVYECEILDLSALPGYSEEKIRVGDIVEVYDEETDTGLKARIVRMQYNVEKPWESKVEIASAHQDIAGEIRALQRDISLVGARYAEEVLRLDTRIDPATSHIFRLDNPHEVTAAQIGIVLPAKVFLLLPGGSIVLPSAQGGAEVNQVDAVSFPYLVVDYPTGGTRTAHWQGLLPADFATGTPVIPIVHWITTATSGFVRWTFRAAGRIQGEDWEAGFPTGPVVTGDFFPNPAAGRVNRSVLPTFQEIAGGQLRSGAVVVFRLTRETASGEAAAPARVVMVELRWQ